MTLKRFEEIRAYLHFNNNENMKPTSDPEHNRAFKVCLVFARFNSAFSSALAPTKQQSI